MSDKKSDDKPAKPADAKKDEAKPAAKAKAKPEEEAPPPPEPGEFGKQLEKKKIPVTHLGTDAVGIEMIALTGKDLIKGAEFLRDKCDFDLLVSCSGVDWKDRLESVYHVYSTKSNKTLAIKVDAENEKSPSLVPVWPAADWHERETYDLLGIQYEGHPRLERILMPSDWLGFPLRKDYKVDDPRLVWNER